MLGGDEPTSRQNGRLAAASPTTYVTPATLLLAGDADQTVPHAQTLEMAAQLQACPTNCAFFRASTAASSAPRRPKPAPSA